MYTHLQIYSILTNKNGSQKPYCPLANQLKRKQREKHAPQGMTGRPQLPFLKWSSKSTSSQGQRAKAAVGDREKVWKQVQ